jgi:hypothetical protein
VDDVDGDAGRLGQADDPVGRLALEDGVAGQAVPDRAGDPSGHEVGGDDVDHGPVLGMHHDQPAVLPGPLHGPEDVVVGAEVDARVGREELELGDALGDELVHLGQRGVVHVRHHHVEAVVDGRVPLGLGAPGVEPLAERATLRLRREVEHRRGAAMGGRFRAALEGVLRERAAEGQLHVGVDVDPARDDVFPGRIDRLVGGDPGTRQVGAEQGDRLTVHEDVRGVRAGGRDDESVRDECAHRVLLRRGRPGCRGGRE